MDDPTSTGWTVEIKTRGRDGDVLYREGAQLAKFYWEFGGGDVVAIVQRCSAEEWREKCPWAAGRRGEILERVTTEVIRQKARTCVADLDDESGEIRFRAKK